MAKLLETDFSYITVDEEDEFEFQCDRCGKCCKNREDVMLSPIDIQQIAKYYDRSSEYIVERYCEVFIGEGSKIPIVRIKPVGIKKQCPFLDKNKCRIHKVKPLFCQLFPLGRAWNIEDNMKMSYILQDIQCGKKGYKQKVKEWIQDVKDEEPLSKIWNNIIYEWSILSSKILNKKYSEKVLDGYYTIIYNKFYLGYNHNEDMMIQLLKRKKELDGLREEIEKTLS